MLRLTPHSSRDTVPHVASSEAFRTGQTPEQNGPEVQIQSQYRAPALPARFGFNREQRAKYVPNGSVWTPPSSFPATYIRGLDGGNSLLTQMCQ